MTDLMLKTTGAVAGQYKVRAGESRWLHSTVRSGVTGYTLALDFVPRAAQGPWHARARLRGNSGGEIYSQDWDIELYEINHA
jgi:hypothetical protein